MANLLISDYFLGNTKIEIDFEEVKHMIRFVVRTDKEISTPMSREEAIKAVKEYEKKGISAYIVSEDEGERLKNSKFNTPKWE